MTDSERSNTWVVWLAGSEKQWYSCVMGVYDNLEEAREYAFSLQRSRGDPGDRVLVQGFTLNDPGIGPEEVLDVATR